MKKFALFLLVLVAAVSMSCSTMGKDSMMAKDTMMAKDGVYLMKGKVMETMNGKTTDLMMKITLKDGTTIMPDGTVMMKDGMSHMLMEGEFYDMDGMKSMMKPEM